MKKPTKYKINPDNLSGIVRESLKKPARFNSRTGFKGVTYIAVRNRYYARAWTKKNPKVSIGGFATAKEAAKAYDAYVRRTIGDWVFCNYKKNGVRTPII